MLKLDEEKEAVKIEKINFLVKEDNFAFWMINRKNNEEIELNLVSFKLKPYR